MSNWTMRELLHPSRDIILLCYFSCTFNYIILTKRGKTKKKKKKSKLTVSPNMQMIQKCLIYLQYQMSDKILQNGKSCMQNLFSHP